MRVCVYGAASETIDPRYLRAGEKLGEAIGKRGWDMVFGGGARGMMGACARGVKAGGGMVTGVTPYFFTDGVGAESILFDGCDEIIRTNTMRQRKQQMEDLSQAFIVTPGGVGTFDEFFEIFTLQSLGQLTKPVAIYNLNHYYDWMNEMLGNAVEAKFVSPECYKLLRIYSQEEELLDYIASSVG